VTAVLGVDASLASTGMVLLADDVRGFHRIRTTDKGNDVSAQINRMRESVVGVVSRFEPLLVGAQISLDLVVMEMPAFSKNNRGTHALAGHYWLMVHALEKYAPIARVSTGTLKKFATGNGAAQKSDVHAAALAAFPGGSIPTSFTAGNDVADASVLAAMGAVHLGVEFGGGFAPSGRASVTAVHWPELREK
jgi:crossover junction endodeoxyribonuclease RuvC